MTTDYGDSKMFWNTHNNNFTECTKRCGLEAKQVGLTCDVLTCI